MISFTRGVCLLLTALLCFYLPTGKAGGDSDIPQNLIVLPQGPSIMLVTWRKPSTTDVSHYFVYVEGEHMQDTTDKTYYVWEGLEDCTTYTFGVKTVSSSGVMSDAAVVDGQTDFSNLPEPQGLRVEDDTYNSVTLAWEKPNTQCDIEHYRVTYQENGSQPKEILVKETTVKVSPLTPETLYTFSVYASTLTGEGSAASITYTTTTPSGDPPQDLVAEGISSSAINVSWSPPALLPDYYSITVLIAGVYDLRVFDTQYLIDGLRPCTTYDITVSSYYAKTDASFPATVWSKTKDDIPLVPTDCSVDAHEGYITVSWHKPTSYCALGPYSVDWTVKKLWGDGEEKSYNETINGLSHSIFDPPPYHSYTFEIAVSVDGIFGDSTSCSGNSLDTNAGPPVLVSVVAEPQGEVRVTWEPPAEENGQIIEYGIFVDNSTNSVKNVSGEMHTTTVTLDGCYSVSISVAARNHADKDDGWGQRSEEKEVIPRNDVLPERLDCLQPGPDVRACWRPYRTYCPVSQYNLQWEGKVTWSPGITDSNSTTLGWSMDEICYDIYSIPYTEYIVRLSVGTNTFEFLNCSTITPMAASSPPTKLQQIAKEAHSVTVEWSLPEFPRGELSGWYLYWTTAIGHFMGEHVTESPDERMMEIRSLQPSEVYYVHVMAVNGAGRGEEAMVEAATQ